MAGLQWPHAWGKHFNKPVPLTTDPLSSKSHRLQEKRQSLMEKLLPRSRLSVSRDVAPLLVEEEGKEASFTKAQQHIYKSSTVTQQHSATAKQRAVDTQNETLHSTAEEYATQRHTGERLFVFRDPPESCDRVDAPKKKKKNFLNLKKCSVAPTNLPWDLQTLCFYADIWSY